ncbi:MAG: hypothetical protein O7A98_02810, partial [Acidobacteria bacterium]|nr:hypothetical protein [Acidobacteriota bacterium]
MASIEQELQHRTRLSGADLARAASRRQEMGGQLETALLELGLLGENELSPALTAHYGLPAATVEDLRSIPASVQALLSHEQAGNYMAIPFAAGPGRVDLAVAGDLDLEKADELAFLLGRRIRLFVINEVRIAQALQRHYSQAQPARLLNLADRLDRGLGRSSDLASEPLPEDEASPVPLPGTFSSFGASPGGKRESSPADLRRRVTPTKPRDERRSIELTDEERQAIFGDAKAAESPSEPAALQVPASGLAKLSNDLQLADSPTAVGGALLDYLENFFPQTLLLRPEGELFRGWLARGREIDRGELRRLITGPGLAKEWRDQLAEEDAVATQLGASAAASGLGKLFRLDEGSPLSLVPVRVQQRIVCLAVGAVKRKLERNERELLGNASLRTGLALQSWILRHKKRPDEAP